MTTATDNGQHAAKVGYKIGAEMPWEQAEDYRYATLYQSQFVDKAAARARGLDQFLDERSYRPGLSAFDSQR